MLLLMKVLSANAESLQNNSHSFDELGGTIGRASDNDWILPDQGRVVSGHHATVFFKEDSFYIREHSSNGTHFISATGNKTLEKSSVVRLTEGMSLQVGHYEITIAVSNPIKEDQPAQMYLPDFLESSIEEDFGASPDLEMLADLDSPISTGAEDLKTLEMGLSIEVGIATVTSPRSSSLPESHPVLRAETSHGLDSRIVDAFFRGAGLDKRQFDLSDPETTFETMGKILSESIQVISSQLRKRSEIKNSLRQQNTLISKQGNNPLKLAPSSQEVIQKFFNHSSGHYQDPFDSLRNADRDLCQNQDSLANRSRASSSFILSKLNPRGFTKDEPKNASFGGLIKKSAKFDIAKFKQTFDQLENIVNSGNLDFH